MPKTEKLLTFDEFRMSHDEALQAQREHLRDDAVAGEILRQGSDQPEWAMWTNHVLATES